MKRGPSEIPYDLKLYSFVLFIVITHNHGLPSFHMSFRHHLASNFFMICLVIVYYYPVFNTSLQLLALSALYLEFVNFEDNSILSLKLFK